MSDLGFRDLKALNAHPSPANTVLPRWVKRRFALPPSLSTISPVLIVDCLWITSPSDFPRGLAPAERGEGGTGFISGFNRDPMTGKEAFLVGLFIFLRTSNVSVCVLMRHLLSGFLLASAHWSVA